MLVLSRKVGEKILIGDDIAVTVVRLSGGGVRIGIDAPVEMAVVREELAAEAGKLEAGKLEAGKSISAGSVSEGENPCEAKPCEANPREANPCEADPCEADPCEAKPREANKSRSAGRTSEKSLPVSKSSEGLDSVARAQPNGLAASSEHLSDSDKRNPTKPR